MVRFLWDSQNVLVAMKILATDPRHIYPNIWQ